MRAAKKQYLIAIESVADLHDYDIHGRTFILHSVSQNDRVCYPLFLHIHKYQNVYSTSLRFSLSIPSTYFFGKFFTPSGSLVVYYNM